MTGRKSIRELLEQSEDELFQQIIDEQEGQLGIEEARRLGGPSQDELARWKERLGALEKRTNQRRRNWKRIAITAAIIAAVLTITVLAVRTDLLNFIETVQEQFTQFSTETPEDTVSEWPDAYLPSYVPTGYIMSDAVDNGGIRAVEYANSRGVRFTFYHYGTDTNIRIDTENADKERIYIGTAKGYLVRKGSLSTLYWSTGAASFSIEYDPTEISNHDIQLIAESVVKIQR